MAFSLLDQGLQVEGRLGFLYISLSTRDSLHVLGVYDEELNVFRFVQVTIGFQEHSGALHGHVGAAVFLDPVNQLEKIDGVGAERPNLLLPDRAWKDNGHDNTAMERLIAFLCLK